MADYKNALRDRVREQKQQVGAEDHRDKAGVFARLSVCDNFISVFGFLTFAKLQMIRVPKWNHAAKLQQTGAQEAPTAHFCSAAH